MVSCNTIADKDKAAITDQHGSSSENKETVSFFPLTNFIQGQLTEIKQSGINPIKFDNAESKDSTWIKIENLESEFSDLLEPVIDSSSMSRYFKETSFLDETLNTVTLTYDPKGVLPPDIPWLHWDIYINPENNKISRIYMVKKIADDIRKQITLIPGISCRMLTLNEKSKNIKSAIISDILIEWNQ